MLQGDGTLERIVADADTLTAMLDPLCGWEGPMDGDSVVRESLAEALMMLVGLATASPSSSLPLVDRG